MHLPLFLIDFGIAFRISLKTFLCSTVQYDCKWAAMFVLRHPYKHTHRAVVSLTVPGGQDFHFPYSFLKFQSHFLIFLILFSFSSSFWPSGWAERPWLRHCIHKVSAMSFTNKQTHSKFPGFCLFQIVKDVIKRKWTLKGIGKISYWLFSVIWKCV